MRILNFADGFGSSSEPSLGTITANNLFQFANDAAFVAYKTEPAVAGDVYWNTTLNHARWFDGTNWVSGVVQDDDGNVVIPGNLTVQGTTTTINTENLVVTDHNIQINNGGNDASAEGAGLTVKRTTTDGSLKYDSALQSKWKLGNAGAEVEVATVSGAQTFTGKTLTSPVINSPTGLTKSDVGLSNVDNTSDANKPISTATQTALDGKEPTITTLPINKGGTGQTTAGAAFDALSPNTTKGDLTARTSSGNTRLPVGANGTVLTADSAETTGLKWTPVATNPMTTAGDIIVGSSGGAPTRLAAGTNGQYLRLSSGTPAWETPTLPTVQRLTSGSGTYTTPAGVKYIRIRMVGGGGGGRGSGTGSWPAATAGGNTTFGSSLLTAGGGGAGGSNTSATTGGTNTIAAGPILLRNNYGQSGAGGGYNSGSTALIAGGAGGSSEFGPGGVGNSGGGEAAGANTGAGGAGARTESVAASFSGGGGGAGGFIEAIIANPASTYAFSVGAGGSGGAAGTSGTGGGGGGSGLIIVEEYY